MQSIKVTILGKQVPLKVDENEVENTRMIANFVDEKLRLYRKELSNQPDSTIMILACLSISEELFELRNKINKIEAGESDLMDQVNHKIGELIEEIS